MKSINKNAPLQCSKSILINASNKQVWDVLTNINNWANWQQEISNPKLNDVLKAGANFKWKTGGANINSTLHTVEPYKYFGWTGKAMGTFAIHNWILQETNGNTTVTVEESMEGLLAKLFKKSFSKSLEKGMIFWLDALKQTCEK